MIKSTGATFGPLVRATAHATDDWLDAPPDLEWMRAMTIECLRDEICDKLDLLHRLAKYNPMLDVDQTVFGVMAEVLSRIGGMVWIPPSHEDPEGWTQECRLLYRSTIRAAFDHGQKRGWATEAKVLRMKDADAPPPEKIIDLQQELDL